MITDKIENIKNYKEIPNQVSDFLKSLTSNSDTGHYEIDESSYANIDEYETKPVSNCKFEAHKKYIDIQMLLSGTEELDFIHTENLKIDEEYDCSRDVMFFKNPSIKPDSLILNPFKFAMIYPHEAHRPQMNAFDKPQKVKKVVVKILIN